ncbi:MAG TPA: hypothetical protein VGK39_06960 [Cyclobacteriaceae bacterium]
MDKMIKEKEFKHASIYLLPHQPSVAVVEANTNYIPLEQFKEIFNFIGDLTAKKKVTKLIFDKRKLSVFHQPSMEWYFVEWKEKMFDAGLTTHRKILPPDEVFRQSVRIGREKINKAYPTKKFNQMDIQYAESIEDALNK